MKISSEKIDLPMLTMHQAQLTYDSFTHLSPLWLSAKRVHTPILDLEDTSIHLEQSQHTNKLFIYSSSTNAIQQIVLTDTMISNGHTIEIPNAYLQQGYDTKWLIEQSKPIKINEDHIDVPVICARSNQQNSMCISGHYQFADQSWKIKHQATHFPITFNTHGMIDLDSEITLHQATIDGNMDVEGHGSSIDSIISSYDVNNINGTISNILPGFPFPIDYDIQGGNIMWKQDHEQYDVKGEFQSPQGGIQLKTENNHIHIHSKNLQLQSSHNHIHTDLDLIYHDNQLSGDISFLSLNIQPDDRDTFQSLPSDIKIIGEAPYFTASNTITTNIELHSNNTPVNIYGFKGNLCGHLTYFLPLKVVKK